MLWAAKMSRPTLVYNSYSHSKKSSFEGKIDRELCYSGYTNKLLRKCV